MGKVKRELSHKERHTKKSTKKKDRKWKKRRGEQPKTESDHGGRKKRGGKT